MGFERHIRAGKKEVELGLEGKQRDQMHEAAKFQGKFKVYFRPILVVSIE